LKRRYYSQNKTDTGKIRITTKNTKCSKKGKWQERILARFAPARSRHSIINKPENGIFNRMDRIYRMTEKR